MTGARMAWTVFELGTLAWLAVIVAVLTLA